MIQITPILVAESDTLIAFMILILASMSNMVSSFYNMLKMRIKYDSMESKYLLLKSILRKRDKECVHIHWPEGELKAIAIWNDDEFTEQVDSIQSFPVPATKFKHFDRIIFN